MISSVLPPDADPPEPVQKYEAEVLILGASTAGLRAAVDAHESGMSVLVLEASESLGGTARSEPASDSHPHAWLDFTRDSLHDRGHPAVYRLTENYGLELERVGADGGERARPELR